MSTQRLADHKLMRMRGWMMGIPISQTDPTKHRIAHLWGSDQAMSPAGFCWDRLQSPGHPSHKLEPHWSCCRCSPRFLLSEGSVQANSSVQSIFAHSSQQFSPNCSSCPRHQSGSGLWTCWCPVVLVVFLRIWQFSKLGIERFLGPLRSILLQCAHVFKHSTLLQSRSSWG